MISVVILGTGNVGTHLIKAFSKAENVQLKQVYSRKIESFSSIDATIKTTTNIANLQDADVYIIAVSDDAIGDVSSKLQFNDTLVVHTSGTVSIDTLKNKGGKGVFYPLQTFSKELNINYKELPICIEAQNDKDLILLNKLAESITNHVYFLDSAQRKQLHLAAVFSNNFVNHLYKIGFDICVENNIPPEILYPLIVETAQKTTKIYPSKAQTGPAKRNDQKTINAQLEMLAGEHKKIYELLTQSIQQTYGKKL